MYIHSKLPSSEESRSHKIIHASDLTKEDEEFCPREFAIMDLYNHRRKKRFIGTALRTTFDVGEAYHDLVREEWAKEICIGTWVCLACGHKHKFTMKPFKCSYDGCTGTSFRYSEEVFWSGEGNYVSSMDMLVKYKNHSKLYIVEIKSIDKDKFKPLVAPLAEHRLRTSLYLRSISMSDHPHRDRINTKKGIIFYVSKGYGIKDTTLKENGIPDMPFTPFKEFVIDRDDESTQYLIDRAIVLDDFRRGSGKVPLPIYPTAMNTRCKSCQFLKICWSGKIPEYNEKT
jgi:CRISPR/Cas system-associated exonuclease Cas4 (RecB family)